MLQSQRPRPAIVSPFSRPPVSPGRRSVVTRNGRPSAGSALAVRVARSDGLMVSSFATESVTVRCMRSATAKTSTQVLEEARRSANILGREESDEQPPVVAGKNLSTALPIASSAGASTPHPATARARQLS